MSRPPAEAFVAYYRQGFNPLHLRALVYLTFAAANRLGRLDAEQVASAIGACKFSTVEALETLGMHVHKRRRGRYQVSNRGVKRAHGLLGVN